MLSLLQVRADSEEFKESRQDCEYVISTRYVSFLAAQLIWLTNVTYLTYFFKRSVLLKKNIVLNFDTNETNLRLQSIKIFGPVFKEF